MRIPDAPVVEVEIDGKARSFDLDDPEMPHWVKERAFESGGFPYSKKMKSDPYREELQILQEELVKVLYWLEESGARVVALFEGRDAAGKGGTISRIRENVNPRRVRNVALPKPSDTERGQWYFQRYVAQFPTAGEMVLFDRSWYNRAGVEPVMGFCTEAEHESFLEEAPAFEAMIKREGIFFFKFWLNIGQEMQLERFHDRRHDPVKIWKLSPVDIQALSKWDEYTKARDLMFDRTDRPHTPWTVIRANDKRRARLNAIRVLLHGLPYSEKDRGRIGEIDSDIVRPASGFGD